jgi:uncharacterized protein (TIGR00369 family)
VSGGDLVRQLVGRSPFASRVGLRLEVLEPDTAEVVLPFSESNVTVGDVVHGGAISTLIDVAATAAVWSAIEPSEGATGVTVGMTVQFLRAARGEEVKARARVTRRGRQICFCDVEVVGSDEQPVARGLVTYRVASEG